MKMANVAFPLDEYTLRARVAPVLAVIVIPVTGVLCWFPAFSVSQLALAAVLGIVLLAMFSQIGRDWGRILQPYLYERWGGQPVVQLLRYRSRLLAKETRERYRLKLESINPGFRVPTELEELADPDKADQRYDSVCLFLREFTRNKAVFPLVYAENVNYGFRRNLLAMKPAGIVLNIAGATSSVLVMLIGIQGGSGVLPLPLVAASLNALMLAWWIVRISSEWVRSAAFAYAERLLGSCDTIQAAVSPPSVVANMSKE